jgi:hypothetical protein
LEITPKGKHNDILNTTVAAIGTGSSLSASDKIVAPQHSKTSASQIVDTRDAPIGNGSEAQCAQSSDNFSSATSSAKHKEHATMTFLTQLLMQDKQELVRDRVWANLEKQVWEQVWQQVHLRVREQVWQQVRLQVREQVWKLTQ